MPTAFNMERGGRGRRGGRGGQSRGGGRGQRTPFATHMQNQAQGCGGRGNSGGIPIAPGGVGLVGQPATQAAAYSNITKMFANWNVCYTCGFDIEDGHTLARAHEGGANQTIKRGLIGTTHRHTLMPDGNQALREGIRHSSRDFDGVWRSMR